MSTDDAKEAKAAALAQTLRAAKLEMETPLQRELEALKARITFQRFCNLMTAGFSEDQAIRLLRKED